jgi:hypothetical protein
MYYKSPSEIAINGVFGSPGSVVSIVDPNGWHLVRPDSPRLNDELNAFKLRRFFKYPGNVFPGIPN